MGGAALQFGLSLAAVIAMVLVAWGLGLGREARPLAGEAEARELADAAVCGFEPAEVALDRAGRAALLADPAGRILLVKQHGVHVAARLLGREAVAEVDGGVLTVSCGDRRFAAVRLDLGDAASVWYARLRTLGG